MKILLSFYSINSMAGEKRGKRVEKDVDGKKKDGDIIDMQIIFLN